MRTPGGHRVPSFARFRGNTVPVTVIAALLAVGVVAVNPAVGSTPAISLTVGGESIADGESTLVSSDPAVGIEVTANATIETVIVRINGSTERTFDPRSSTFSEEVRPALEYGHNAFTVISKTEDGSVRSAEITIKKDDRGPYLEFTAPMTSASKFHSAPDSVEVPDARTTLEGKLHDVSEIDLVEITHRFEYRFAGDYRAATKSYDLEDPGATISQPLYLGDGVNEITVRVEDELDHVRVYETEIVVKDAEKPTVTSSLPEKTGIPSIDMDTTVSDNVQLASIELVEGGKTLSTDFYSTTNPKPVPDRQSYTIDREIELEPGKNEIRITAVDLAGNTVTWTRTVTYDRKTLPVLDMRKSDVVFESEGLIAFDGTVKYGYVDSVVVETVDAESGKVVDVEQIDADGSGEPVSVKGTLDAADGPTRVTVRVIDTRDREFTRSFTLQPPEAPSGETGTTTSTTTSTPSGSPTTTASNGGTGSTAQGGGNGQSASSSGTDSDESSPTPSDAGGLLPAIGGLRLLAIPAVIAVLMLVVYRLR